MKDSTIKIQRSGLFNTSIIQDDLKTIESRIVFVKTTMDALKQCDAGGKH